MDKDQSNGHHKKQASKTDFNERLSSKNKKKKKKKPFNERRFLRICNPLYKTLAAQMEPSAKPGMEKEVKLFGIWSSPFVLRIKWALRIKGVEYEYIEEDLSNKSNLLLEYNPVHKKVPVIVHNGKPIAESAVILEYIEETWKNNPILPEEPYERAMARFWCKFGEDKLSPPMWRLFITQGKEQEEAYALAIENLKILEQELQGKKFFCGETIGLTDISFGPLAYAIPIYEDVTKLKMIDAERFPLLSAWMEAFLNSPVVRDSLPPGDKLLVRYRALHESFLAEGSK